ncbi:hypothetical protein FSB96_04490 [Enterococcus faecium]|nr:hypothetical protein [Enterococcus faecium]
MGLKFERTDNLDKLFESFAVDPEKTVAPKEEIDRFLKPQPQNEKKKDKKQKGSIIYGTDESELILQPHFHFRY